MNNNDLLIIFYITKNILSYIYLYVQKFLLLNIFDMQLFTNGYEYFSEGL